MTQFRRPGTRALTFLAAFALVAAACGADDGTASPGEPGASPDTSPVAPGETPAESPAESPGNGAGDYPNIGGTVSVVGSWTGAEQDSFMAMVAPFEEMTGITVEYTGSRDLAAQLTTGIAGGQLPDVAGLPGPGLMIEWYEQGALQSLDFVDLDGYRGDTPEGYADLGVADDGTLIGIFVKSAVKGLVWYNTEHWEGEPGTWDELQQSAQQQAEGDTQAWCIGWESGAASGWPGTDWIENILLRQSGPEVYDAWVRGEQQWSSTEVRQAFETLGQALENANGGSNYIVTTNFGSAANPMFDDPPGCLLHHQASFITDFFQNEAGATEGDYDFFNFPDINEQYAGSVVGAGDLFGMFNDTEQARLLIQWLLEPEAQQIWVERGGALSGNRNVPLDAYPDEVSRRSAEILQQAQTFRFDGSDMMPNAMNDAFFGAIMDFTQNPGNLDSILQRLDQVQQDAYAE
jgi:alpha-glucoside transport system substrate-binding protein